jgi:hypothetical protein
MNMPGYKEERKEFDKPIFTIPEQAPNISKITNLQKSDGKTLQEIALKEAEQTKWDNMSPLEAAGKIKEILIKLGLDPCTLDNKILPIDPNKIYLMFLGGKDFGDVDEMVKSLHPFFKEGKGEMLLVNSKVSITEWSLDDLKLVKDQIKKAIRAIEKKNLKLRSRYEIMREEKANQKSE